MVPQLDLVNKGNVMDSRYGYHLALKCHCDWKWDTTLEHMDWHNQWSTQNLVKAVELTEYHCWKWLHLYLMMKHACKAIFPSTAISNSSQGCSRCSLYLNIPTICKSWKHNNSLVLNLTIQKIDCVESSNFDKGTCWISSSKVFWQQKNTHIVHFSTHLASPHKY